MRILGVNLSNNGSICLLNDGKIELYLEAERLTKKKRDSDCTKLFELVKDIDKAGVDDCLVVDAPHELKEENILREELNKKGLSLIKLVAPTTDDNRLQDIIKISSGFLYQVNEAGFKGVK